ncbi:MAG: LCP family protein [Erysipelotrichaceae bacterium]|nr:LCP family protein [Erysipelotrichaceae bacterium]
MKTKQINKLVDIFSLILPVTFTLLGLYFVVLLTRYTEVSSTLIIMIAIILISVILLINLTTIYGFFTKKNVFKIIAISLALVLSFAAAYGIYYIKSVNDSIDEIIVDGTEKEIATVAFVTYDNLIIKKIDDLKQSNKFGYIDNEAFQVGNVLALEEIENQNIKIELVPFDTYNDLLLGLFNKEVDVAALPDNYYEMFVVNDGYQDYLDKTRIIHTYSKEVDTNGLAAVDKDLTKEPFTMLLIGVDEERSDSLILASFNPQRMTVTMTNIARDSFVPIACYKNNQYDKINHARVVSRGCTIKTVEQLLDVEIDFFVEVNFKGVVEIVDAIGGLWLTSPVRFIGQTASYDRGTYTVWVDKGYQLMNGEQVLAFARERHHMPQGDFTRQENQKAIIINLFSTLLEMKDLNKALSVVKAAGSNVSTNMSLSQMTQLLNFGFDSLNNTYVGRVNSTSIFQIISTRIVGYESWTYNEGLQLPLWIYKLYNGSIKDNVAYINRNLQIDQKLNEFYNANFDILYPYYWPVSFTPDEYNEPKVHEKLPDFMMAMVKNAWTLEDVQEWHKTRQWITLKLTPVIYGDKLYDEAYAHHRVVYQSVNYGVKTSNIKQLEISYIQKDLDCSISDNQKYIECSDSYVVPKFIGFSQANIDKWKTDHPGITVDVVYVDNTSTIEGVTYDANMANKIGAQSVSQYAKWGAVNNKITVYFFNYPKANLRVSELLTLSGENTVKDWFVNSGWITEPEISRVYDTASANRVITVRVRKDDGSFETLTSDTSNYRINRKVFVTLSRGIEVPTPLPNFVGLYLSDFQAYMNDINLDMSSVTYVRIDRPEGSDSTWIDKITIQSVSAGEKDYRIIRAITITLYQ